MAVTSVNTLSFVSHSSGRNDYSWVPPTGVLDYQQPITLVRTRTGQRLTNWRKIIEDGGNATTPLTAVWESLDTRSSPKQHIKFHHVTNGRKVDSWASGYCVLSNSSRTMRPQVAQIGTDFVDNLARAQFYKKLSNMRTKFHGLTFAGELRESLHMLRRPAAALWTSAEGYLASLGKRKRASPKHWTKAVSGLWLEHSFGWLPLINDCKDAVAAYSALTNPKPQILKISGSARKEYDTTKSRLNGVIWTQAGETRGINGGPNWVVTKGTFIERHVVRYRGAMRSQVEAPQWDNAGDLFGFRPAEFIPTAWELLPWSFLVDYFTNIGDLLNCVITDTKDVAWVNKSVIQETEWGCWAKPDPVNTMSVYGGGYVLDSWDSQGGYCVVKRRTVTRTANSGIPLPRLQLSFDLTDGQLGNIAALLGQARALHPQNFRHR